MNDQQQLTPDEAERARRFAHYLASPRHPTPDAATDTHRSAATTAAYDMRPAPEQPSK